ncbi:MAG: ATP-binding protein [Phycisphaerae bacterium]|nr:ATP-binding protein [Phycisphaerae bacterium]
MTESALELRFLSHAENLASVRACVDRFAASVGFDEERRGRIVLAVDEAITNSIRHGYGSRTDGPITLRLAELDGGGVRIELEDEGKQVDPGNLTPRDLSDVRPGGLGIHIIRSTFQNCRWVRKQDTGMAVTLELPLTSSLKDLPRRAP